MRLKYERAVCHSPFYACKDKGAQIFRRRKSVGRFIGRKLWLVKGKLKIAHIGNFDRIFNCALILAEKHLHLCSIFIIKLVHLKTNRSAIGYNGICLNAHKHRLRGCVFTAQVVAVVSCNKRQRAFLGKPYKLRQYLQLLTQTVILKLDIKVILAEYCRKLLGILNRGVIISRRQKRGDLSRKTRGERDQALGMLSKQLHIYTRL